MLRAVLLSAFSLFVAAPAFADELKCGPHEHVISERDPEEGAMTKRCVCDEGWDATGPAPPCKERAKTGTKTPPPAPKDHPKK